MTSLVAVIYPIKVRARPHHHPILELGDAFASGIFLGAALFHMLPDAINGFANTLKDTHYPIAEFFCACGFLVLLFLERIAQCIPHVKDAKHAMPYMVALILIIHSLIEGGVLGINTTMATAFVIFCFMHSLMMINVMQSRHIKKSARSKCIKPCRPHLA